MQTYTDRLLTTVYFSLGAVVVVAGLLVGFGWYTSFRVHERDLAAIRNELTAAQQNDIQRLRLELTTSTQQGLTEISARSEETARKSVTASLVPLQAKVNGLASTVSSLESRLARLTFQAESWYWEHAGVKENQLRFELELLRLAHREKDDVEIPTRLQNLQSIVESGASLYSVDVSDIVAIIDQLPSQFAVNAEGLRNALRTAPRL